MSSTTSTYPVYVGLWTDWSHGPVMGKTLTVTGSDGALIIAFVAFFITMIGSQVWRIICFILHRLYSAPRAQDALHNQRQVILRNSASPVGGAWELVKLTLAWRNAQARSLMRLLPLVLGTAVIACALVMASGFSSQILLRSEVLIAGGHCGLIKDHIENVRDHLLHIRLYWTRTYEMAASYAQRCYREDSQTSDCGFMAKKSLPMTIDSRADCPFNESLCLSGDSNILIDSGLLDSHDDLGMNSPPESRFQYREVLHCAPLTTDGHRSNFTDRFNRTYSLYEYGPIGLKRPDDASDSTFAAPLDILQPSQKSFAETIGANYAVDTATASYQNGALVKTTGFRPIPDFNRTDGELDLIALSTNLVVFMEKSADLWYRATKPLAVTAVLGNETTETTFWLADEPVWPMGCVTQRQFCLPGKDRCTSLGSGYDVVPEFAELLSSDLEQASRWTVISSSLHFIVGVLGTQSLTSRFSFTSDKMQATLEPNQWQLDVINWFSISMASLQLAPLERAAGPAAANPALEPFVIKPNTDEQKSICQNQKIFSTDYMSFSFFGLLFIFIFGMLVTFLALTIDFLASWLQQAWRLDAYANLEWRATYKLHLQRLAYETLPSGHWKNGFLDVPVTEPGVKLPVFDVSNTETICLVDSNTPMFAQDKEGKGSYDIQASAISAQVSHEENSYPVSDEVRSINSTINNNSLVQQPTQNYSTTLPQARPEDLEAIIPQDRIGDYKNQTDGISVVGQEGLSSTRDFGGDRTQVKNHIV
ncbi:cytochrome p450 protein [Paramyrothecium foliicola]|nr:cytochrome p450 protein [Paramyrothecium foliicola]